MPSRQARETDGEVGSWASDAGDGILYTHTWEDLDQVHICKEPRRISLSNTVWQIQIAV